MGLYKSVKSSNSTLAKITNGEMVEMPILEKICAELECNITIYRAGKFIAR